MQMQKVHGEVHIQSLRITAGGGCARRAIIGAEIYYTIDGSTPSKENGIRYTGEIVVMDSLTIKAVAVKDGMSDSMVMTESYVFSNVNEEIVTIPQFIIS